MMGVLAAQDGDSIERAHRYGPGIDPDALWEFEDAAYSEEVERTGRIPMKDVDPADRFAEAARRIVAGSDESRNCG